MPNFGPLGNSQVASITQSSQRFAIGSVPANVPALRLASIGAANQLAWWVKLGDNTVTVDYNDGQRIESASVDNPYILPITGSPTHIAIICEGIPGDVLISTGTIIDGRFSIIGDGIGIAVTQTDQRIALPALGSSHPAFSLVPLQNGIESLWIKLGDGTVTGSHTTSMRLRPGSPNDPAIIPVSSSETHLSIFCDGTPGTVILMPGDLLGVVGTNGTNGANGVSTGLRWNFDSSTSMADPGTGDFRLNNATIASVTAAAFSDLCGETGNPDVSAWVLSWDDVAGSVRGTLVIKKIGAEQNFAIFNITGASTDNSGWTQLALTHVTSSGSFSNTDGCEVSFVRAGSGGLGSIVIQTFTATGTYTPTSGMAYCLVEAQGSGGGGGGADGAYGSSAGGGGGEYRKGVFSAATIGASQSVTINAAGTAGSNTGGNGGNGGTAVFGALMTANGGSGGTGSGSNNGTQSSRAGGAGGSGGSGGSYSLPGQAGETVFEAVYQEAIGGTNAASPGGAGGDSHLGFGGQGRWGTATGVAGSNGTNYGGGGSGGSVASNTGVAGGAGGAGIIIITEFVS